MHHLDEDHAKAGPTEKMTIEERFEKRKKSLEKTTESFIRTFTDLRENNYKLERENWQLKDRIKDLEELLKKKSSV
jgi:predicted RNase H-like nuclease (RuvC/YqgF family)